MDCRSEDTTVDLCSEPECINSTFEGADRKMHTPSHRMFKIYRIIFDRDLGRVEETAKNALDSARGTLSEFEGMKPMPECVHCNTTISLPCWYCVDCTGERELQY